MSDDLLPYFIAEGRELCERARDALAQMANGAQGAAAESAFRALHTLKGSAALFDFAELTALLHAAESELDAARRGTAASERLDALGACIDETERWIDALAADGSVAPKRRRAAAKLEARFQAPKATAAAVAPAADWAQALAAASGVVGARAAVRYKPDADAYFRGEDPLARMRDIPGLVWLDLNLDGEDADTPFSCRLILEALSGAPTAAVAAALSGLGDQIEIAQVEAAALAVPAPTRAPESRTLRVDAASLDAASELIEQLLVAKNLLAHETAAALARPAGRALASAQLTLDRAAIALHGALGRMRLSPLRRLLSPLPRQVRDMAAALGKQAELVVSGDDVAVDKAILDGLYEPLIHILRNAVDHGLETPEARVAQAKPARGEIRLAVATRADAAVIEVSDDGRGLDLARIRALAVERGLVAPEAALTDAEAADLIFRPGFSTARAVTDLSGRGVGLDAVRSALVPIGGRVEVESRAGEGATLRMTFPLRATLTRVAVLGVGTERFGVALNAVRHTLRAPRAEISAVGGGEAVVARDEVLPLVHLGALLGGEPCRADPLTLIVVGGVAIAVDRVAETLQASVQSVPPLLAGIAGLTGSVLMGDGSVLAVLDLAVLTS